MDFVFNLQYYSTIYYNMFSCNDCSFSSELDLYCKHVKLWHQKSHYNCGQGGCGNVYSDINALKRHLKSNHITSATGTFSTNSNCYNIEDPFVATVNSEITLNDEHNEQANEQVSVKDIVEKYRLYILSLYSDPAMNRKKANSIAKNSSKIIIDLLRTLKNDINAAVNCGNRSAISEIFERAEIEFKVPLTEKNVTSHLREEGLYRDPIKFTLEEGVADTLHHRRLTLNNKKSTAVQMDIGFIIISFFELPDMFKACMECMTDLKNTVEIKNVIQGQSWLERNHDNSTKIVIPFCLYHDDFEPGNSLGANSGIQSLCSFFIHFPTLPQHIATALDNILPILSCNTSQKKYGLNKILQPTLKSFKSLEETGIELSVDGENIKVYFELCLLIGDNKALNELAGMTQCFVKDGFYRMCYCTVEESKIQTSENEENLRTIKKYNEDVGLKNFKTSGIKEECVFNELLSFHIISCP